MDKTILEEVNDVIQTAVKGIGEQIKKNHECVEAKNKELSTQCLDLKKQFDTLEAANNDIKGQLESLKETISQKSDAELVNKKHNELSQELKKKDALMESALRKHDLNTCLFLCVMMLLNIVAIWTIIYRPGYSGSVGAVALPWYCIVSLAAITLTNVAATIIWDHFIHEEVAFYWGEIITEFFLLVFNTVVMWLFAFYPLEEVTGAVITLAVFLTLANALALFMRIIQFSCKLTSARPDCDVASLAVCIIETLLLVVILVILVGWIRV